MQNSAVSARGNNSVPAAQATGVEEFRSIVSHSFVPLDIHGLDTRPFIARVRSVKAGQVAFTEVVANPHLVERNTNTIADGGSGMYKVSLLLAGSGVLVQDGKELVMQPGELTIYDTSRPYSLLFDQNIRNVVMMFPKDRLQLPSSFTDQLTAVSFTQEHPTLSSIASAFLSKFPTQLKTLTPHTAAQLARASIELIETLCSGTLDATLQQTDPNHITMQSVYQFIEANLGDHDLSPSSIAAAHFISTRHLHSLFTQRETTVSTWIRELRLERCFQDLQNPVLADQTVLAIATRWGFADAAHFSRVFKAKFGVSPRQLRQTLLLR